MTATLDNVLDALLEIHAELRHLRLLQEASVGDALAPADDFEDVKVQFDPKTWRGEHFKGCRVSECPAEYLDHLARALVAIARKELADKKVYKGNPAHVYTLQRAARVRRWALRKRMGWTPPEQVEETRTANPFGGSGGFGSGGGLGASTGLGAAPLGDPEPIADDDFPFGANAPSADSETNEDDDEQPL